MGQGLALRVTKARKETKRKVKKVKPVRVVAKEIRANLVQTEAMETKVLLVALVQRVTQVQLVPTALKVKRAKQV